MNTDVQADQKTVASGQGSVRAQPSHLFPPAGIGRIVHYVTGDGIHLAALITIVHQDFVVGLSVAQEPAAINRGGPCWVAVSRSDFDPTATKEGTWHYPERVAEVASGQLHANPSDEIRQDGTLSPIQNSQNKNFLKQKSDNAPGALPVEQSAATGDGASGARTAAAPHT